MTRLVQDSPFVMFTNLTIKDVSHSFKLDESAPTSTIGVIQYLAVKDKLKHPHAVLLKGEALFISHSFEAMTILGKVFLPLTVSSALLDDVDLHAVFHVVDDMKRASPCVSVVGRDNYALIQLCKFNVRFNFANHALTSADIPVPNSSQ